MTMTKNITIKTSEYIPEGSMIMQMDSAKGPSQSVFAVYHNGQFKAVNSSNILPDPTNNNNLSNIPAYTFSNGNNTGFYLTGNGGVNYVVKGITYEVFEEKDYKIIDPFDNTIFETHGVFIFPGEYSSGDPHIDGTVLIPHYYRKAYFPELELLDVIPLKLQIPGPDGDQNAFVLLNTRNQNDKTSRIYRSGRRYTFTNPKFTIITDNLEIMKKLEEHRKIRFINNWKGPKC